MTSLNDFIKLLEQLEKKKIYYKLNKTRTDTVMIEVAVPSQRWEIEYNTYGDPSKCHIEIEKFISDGTIYGKEELKTLLGNFSD